MPPKNKYTNSKLRNEVKEEVQQSDKGGAPGQWSARKAQLMAKEYKKRGGGYTTDKSDKDESQKSLTKWGDEEWQTKEGSGNAKQEDGTEKRYLPKEAWEHMSEKEKEETEAKKMEGGKKGRQHVANTSRAREERKKAGKTQESKGQTAHAGDDEKEGKTVRQTRAKRQPVNRGKNATEEKEEKGDEEDARTSSETSREGAGIEKGQESGPPHGQKRGRGKKDDEEREEQEGGSGKQKRQKKQKSDGGTKTVGSKHDSEEAPAPVASKDRLPKKGQRAHWKALPGWVEGEVVEVLKKGKEVDGKQVKASATDPRIVLKSKSSGKMCVHKVDNVYFG